MFVCFQGSQSSVVILPVEVQQRLRELKKFHLSARLNSSPNKIRIFYPEVM